MNKNIYDEAVADAHRLRELAEETAKNRVVEAVMPQIRDLVNRRILGEDIEMGDMVLPGEEEEDQTYVELSPDADIPPTVGIDVTGDVNINLDVDSSSGDEQDDDDDLVLDDRMSEVLDRLIKGEISSDDALSERVNTLYNRVKRLTEVFSMVNESNLSAAQKTRMKNSFWQCVREALKLRSEIIITERKTQERLERTLTETIKEIKHMSKSNRRNIFDFLFEEEGRMGMQERELDEAELSLELTNDEEEELANAEEPAAVEDALEDILGDLEVSLETEETLTDDGEGAAEDGGEGEPALDAAEGGEEDLLGAEDGDLEEVYEIDENLLKRELTKMMKLREEAENALDGSEFGDGEAVGDVILDIDEDDLINVLADEIGNTDVPATAPMVASESRRRRSRRTNRSRSAGNLARKLQESRRETSQYKTALAGLKNQLVEMNLFNAKLLYANKLMQNKNLTMKQQKAIVEALDNAKTLREAKLLFKSLSESLTRRTKGSKINEGSLRTLGSSSRSTRSAQPSSNGVEVDRWAVLAGLSSKN
jgi:hypothetical protein